MGLLFACELFIMASGMSLVFGTFDFLNLAHGSFLEMGVYVFMSLATIMFAFNFPFYGIILIYILSCVVIGLIGAVIEFFVFKRIYGKGWMPQLLLTFGMSLIIGDAILNIWGGRAFTISRVASELKSVEIANQIVPIYYIVILAVSVVTGLLLYILLFKTWFGKIIRATGVNRQMVEVLGVNVRRLSTQVFFIGCALAALGGVLVAPIISISPGLGAEPFILSFAAVVMGGVGSLKGLALTSLIIGIVRVIMIAIFPEIELAVIFILLIITLIIKPQGLFGG
jgi:branched-chain amino acid transport system permease protein